MSDQLLRTADEIYANAGRLVAGVRPDQWSEQTPCNEWDVRALVNHMIGTTKVLGAGAARTAPSGTPDDDHLGDADPATVFADAAQVTMGAWRSEGALDGSVTLPFEMPAAASLGVNVLDIGTHCWDLALATDQDHGLSDEHVAVIDHWNHQMINEQVRSGGGFGQVLPPADGGGLAGMLAFVGRTAR